MIQDGSGYGRSTYWQITAKDMAKHTKEACICMTELPKILITSEDGGLRTANLYIIVKDCSHDHKKTDRMLTQKFKEFYK